MQKNALVQVNYFLSKFLSTNSVFLNKQYFWSSIAKRKPNHTFVFRSLDYYRNINTHNSQKKDRIQTAEHKRAQELLRKATENANILPPSALVVELCEIFKRLDKREKVSFFEILVQNSDVDRQNLMITARYDLLFETIHQLPNGLKTLAEMRASLLDIMGSKENETYKQFSNLEQNIWLKLKKHVIGSLKFERITWETSSAELLEKICKYEAVHQVKGWKDIKRRLGPDRRVYAFFENNMLNEPLAFVHVALVPKISNSVQAILNAPMPSEKMVLDRLEELKCAICYTITTQPGLGGINLGKYLIKEAVNDLQVNFPQLEMFATLSPMPGYREWLRSKIGNEENNSVQAEFAHIENWKAKMSRFNNEDKDELKEPLMKLCARYIISERDHTCKSVLDPVANFHLKNGASVHQIHWQANTSHKGIEESFGIMINYCYVPKYLERNYHNYLERCEVAVSEKDPKVEVNWLQNYYFRCHTEDNSNGI